MRIITSGHTRVVILAGDYAFKIARFHLLRFVSRTLQILCTGQLFRKIERWQKEADGAAQVVKRAVRSATVAGFLANRQEWKLSTCAASHGLVPTYFTLLYIVNVQARGEPLGDTDISSHPLVERTRMCEKSEYDLQPHQFCLREGSVVLADYGFPSLASLITAR